MKKKQERHILALSGGKDSAALAVYMREKYPEIPLEYVFIDSGCELPETYAYLNKIRAILNIKIIVIRPKRNFDYWLKYFGGVLPSPTNRWCTRLLKLLPYNKWLKDSYSKARIFSYVGLRADEGREGRPRPRCLPDRDVQHGKGNRAEERGLLPRAGRGDRGAGGEGHLRQAGQRGEGARGDPRPHLRHARPA